MAEQIKRIRSAVTDGRAQAPRYIQKQLTCLHEALRKHQQAIHSAIRRDSDFTSTEADSEIYLALKALRQEYEALDFVKFLELEYSIAHGKENVSRRVAVGSVYIIPSRHSRFYSIIQAMSTAIAAGNCVMVEIEQTTSELGSLLRKIFTETMDKDTFALFESKPSDPEFFSQHCVVIDGRSEPAPHAAHSVLSAPSSRTVAVVDRSSNVNEAAQELVRARLSFRGSSSYSPDLILVNEFVLKEFCGAAARYATEHVGFSMPDENARASKAKPESDLQKELQKSGATTLVSGSRGSIVLVQERNSNLLNKKITETILIVHPIRSLDDAIDVANSKTIPLLATYLFAAPSSAKYLSQFIDARASFTNYVPVELLVGSAAPTGFKTSLSLRYTKDMFSSARPEYITPSPENRLLRQTLGQNENEHRQKMEAEFSIPLPPMNEPLGHAIGFFEQGLFTGGGLVVASAITGLAVALRYAGPMVMKRLR